MALLKRLCTLPRAFAADYPRCRPLLLYRGAERVEIGGIRCVPVEDFLSRLRPEAAPPETE